MSTITINNTQEKMTIKAALAEFFEALNAMFTGDLAPMEALWSHADDVTYMGPAGGYRVGWAEVRADWAEQAALKLGGEVKPSEIRITKADNLAAAQYYVVGENFDPNGNPEAIAGNLPRGQALRLRGDRQGRLAGIILFIQGDIAIDDLPQCLGDGSGADRLAARRARPAPRSATGAPARRAACRAARS